MPPKKFVPTDEMFKEAVREEEEVPATAVVEPETHEVRLRNETMSLPVSVDCDGRVLRYSLPPNQWVKVPDPIYELLRRKFALRSDVTRQVPDALENERHPHGKGEEAIMREEQRPGYIIEFR